MSQWGATDDAANSVSWAAETIQAGSGKANIAANNTALYNNTTPSAFITNMEIGQFGVSKAEMANTSSEGKKAHAPGWALRRNGVGGIKSIAITGGTGFGNGETIVVTGGETNGLITVTTNATGNVVSGSVSTSGLFQNTSVTYSYQRQKHLLSITAGGTGTGYSNTDYVLASNGTVDGRGTVTTNATGGLGAGEGSVTVGNTTGLWANNAANNTVTLTIKAANGAASNGTGATLTANLTTSTVNATVSSITLGGRAGRVTYETLAVVKGLTSGTTDDTQLPQA